MSIPHVLRYVMDQPWAIQREKLQAIMTMLARHDAGVKLTEEQLRAAVGNPPPRPAPSVAEAIAVVPLYGTITQRADMLTDMSGGTALTRWAKGFRQLAADPGIKAIVIDVDSPGGTIYGVPEMADEIFAARNAARPIVAVANSLAASAAYWLASQADEIVATPGGDVGSIGVYTVHEDWSKALEEAGIAVTFISAGEGKTDGNDAEPLSDEARVKLQKRVDQAYGLFTKQVARGRGVSTDVVRKEWKAELYGAQEALSLGQADRVATLEETLARLSSGSGRRSSFRGAAADDGDADRRLRRLRMTGA